MFPKKYLSIFLLILIFQIVLLLIFVFFRLIDYDEASYLSAAHSVKTGKLPYVDFFYAQMPYIPYAYALVSSFGLASLFWGRLISALASLVLGLALFGFAYKSSQNAKISLSLFFLYSFNGLLLTWHSVVKTLVLSDLFGFFSFIFFASYLRSGDDRQNAKILLAGFFVGIALNLRLTFSLIWLAEGILIFVLSSMQNKKQKMIAFLFFCLGTTLSSSFAIYLFLKDPGAFIFDNLTYHQILGAGFIKLGFLKRILTVFKFLFYPQNLFIIFLALFGLIVSFKKRINRGRYVLNHKIILSSFIFGIVMIVTSFSISPTTFQHYEQALPFFLISLIPTLSHLESRWGNRKIFLGGISTLYIFFVIPFIVIFIFSVRDRDKPYPISEVRKVVKVVEENSEPKEIVFSTWPAYVVFAKREPVPGLETWGWEVAHLLSPQELKKSKLINRQKMEEIILEKKVGLIVSFCSDLSGLENLLDVNYRHIKTIGDTKIYKAK
jgi:hypothetical protein